MYVSMPATLAAFTALAASTGPQLEVAVGSSKRLVARTMALWLKDAAGAVSYTHLDVYKRQVIQRGGEVDVANDAWIAA